MLEYGNGVGEVAGRATGGGPGQTVDVGASIGHAVGSSVQAISTLPPAMILAGVVLIVLGLLFVRRAF